MCNKISALSEHSFALTIGPQWWPKVEYKCNSLINLESIQREGLPKIPDGLCVKCSYE